MRAILILLFSFGFYGCKPDSDSAEDNLTCAKNSCGHCLVDRKGIRICKVVYTPTESESISVINYTELDQDLTSWSLWDANGLGNGNGQENLIGTVKAGDTVVFDALNFAINDTAETIVLKNESDTEVDRVGL